MPRQTVAGMRGIQRDDLPIAGDLGQDGGGGDRRVGGVPADQGPAQHRQLGAAIAVDVRPIEGVASVEQGEHGASHGEHRGVQDIELVDLGDARLGNRPARGVLANLVEQRLAAALGELLGIVEQSDRAGGVEDHGGGNHGTGERTAPGLVDTAVTARVVQIVKQVGLRHTRAHSLLPPMFPGAAWIPRLIAILTRAS